MKKYSDLVNECRTTVTEVMPWDLVESLSKEKPLLLDVREANEYSTLRIEDSINVPRGILEQACEYGFEETVPVLVEARERPIVVICRSGNRSLLAARTLQELGYRQVSSLATGLRGWNDYEQPLVEQNGEVVSPDFADDCFKTKLRPDQIKPTR